MHPSDPQFPPRPTSVAQDFLRPLIQSGDLVIDATAGNGHDTVFLAECVGPLGKVLAFDVQEAALKAARHRLGLAGFTDRVYFYCESHTKMLDRASAGSVTAIMFNLGFLPGEGHGLTTHADETLAAFEVAVNLLMDGGILSVVCYPGHPAGAIEAEAVKKWMSGLTPAGWRVANYGALGTRKPAPFLLVGRKPNLNL